MGHDRFFLEVETDHDALAGHEGDLVGFCEGVHQGLGAGFEFELFDFDFEEIFGGFGSLAIVGGGVELAAGLEAECGGGELVGAGGTGVGHDAGEEDVGAAVDADFDAAAGFFFKGAADFVGGGGANDQMR